MVTELAQENIESKQLAHGNDKEIKQNSEQHKLLLLRSLIESKDPSAKDADDLMLRRFLRARELDVNKACGMFLKYLKWRRTFVPNGHISETEIEYDLAANKMFLQGFDKQGRPINVVMGSRHFQNPKPGGLDEFKRFCVYSLDKICSRMPEGQEKYLGIADLSGWGYSNSDIRAYVGVLAILQDCYPERLGKLLIVHAPRLFMTVWKIVYPFIDEKTKTKIVFVEDRNLKSTLLEDIDESQLPEIYGGKMTLVPIQEA
ncbi:CRAL-TRIO domain-containing protein YKL091C-like [Amaranthus tricolor]|uniref:CRAL-TRIO domain-containing protein YKL091C-like n=1 Tax=Amaranthus tricolor TaxID=29722 RepID=UPI00258CB830|nr:CRAL-TRIO domain-containing protein YKL091C-like [Amaranthus tricolor]